MYRYNRIYRYIQYTSRRLGIQTIDTSRVSLDSSLYQTSLDQSSTIYSTTTLALVLYHTYNTRDEILIYEIRDTRYTRALRAPQYAQTHQNTKPTKHQSHNTKIIRYKIYRYKIYYILYTRYTVQVPVYKYEYKYTNVQKHIQNQHVI